MSILIIIVSKTIYSGLSFRTIRFCFLSVFELLFIIHVLILSSCFHQFFFFPCRTLSSFPLYYQSYLLHCHIYSLMPPAFGDNSGQKKKKFITFMVFKSAYLILCLVFHLEINCTPHQQRSHYLKQYLYDGAFHRYPHSWVFGFILTKSYKVKFIKDFASLDNHQVQPNLLKVFS